MLSGEIYRMTIEYKDSKRIVANEADVAVVSNRGTIDTSSSAGNTIITFTEDGTFTPTSAFDIEYLIVGGGGSGGSGGSGGGAGGFRTATGQSVTAQNYTVTVGAGGTGVSGDVHGNSGISSSFIGGAISITGTGGGYGSAANYVGGNGGSGGGAGGSASFKAGGISSPVTSPVQGYAGGNQIGVLNPYAGAGGGGAGALGGNVINASTAGAGGVGKINPITGSTSGVLSGGNYYLGGGGGGGIHNSTSATVGTGGTGGGGNGGSTGSGTSGTANTGGGGGGSPYNSGTTGSGGSGIVIIKFVTSGNTYDPSLNLSGKPTNVQDNSILVEKDTGNRYWFGSGVWTKSLGGFALIYGGGGSSTEKFSWSTKTSVSGTALAGNDQGQAALCEGAVAGYFASGHRGGYINTIYKYNYSDSVITTKSATTSAVHSWGGNWSTPTIGYVVRGNNNGGYGTTVEKYNYAGDSRTAGTSLTNGSSDTSTHQTQTVGYATSRWAAASYGDTEKYTFSSDSKTTGTSLTLATSANGAGTITSTGVIAGGQTGNSTGYQTRIELYNHSNDAVTTATNSLTVAGLSSSRSYGNNEYALFVNVGTAATTVLNDYTYSTGVVTSPTTLVTARNSATSSTTSSNEVIE